MKKNGASLLVYALEQIGVSKAFGIPGVHNAEIYNQLSQSRFIEPVIVTHELSAGYMADAVSRTSSSIGTIVIVPGAGLTHAMSAIGEAFVDGIPLLVISGGINRDAGKSFQMHQLDMERVTNGIVKGYYLLQEARQIISTIYNAYNTAISGEPGPVFIEIPIKTQLIQESVQLIEYKREPKENPFIEENPEVTNGMNLFAEKESVNSKLTRVIDLLSGASFPGIYVGWGAREAVEEIENLAELLIAPVATTIQGISAFSYEHPMHAGIGFGPNSSPASQEAFKNCDCLLAVGLKFSELATGNYQMELPENLVHIDINSNVFNKNYLAKVALEGDAKTVLTEILKHLKEKRINSKNDKEHLVKRIQLQKGEYQKTWFTKPGESMVTPGFFYNALRNSLPQEAIIVADDGNHMLLTAELFPIYKNGQFICPTDYSGMGYGIPAAIGAKLLNRQKSVVAIVGDGGLLMCGNELITAHIHKIGLLVFVFRDTRSEKIARDQLIDRPNAPLDLLGAIDLEGFAKSVRANYMKMKTDIDISGVLTKANEQISSGKTVLVEVNIDYSRKASFATGLLKPKSNRISFTDKIKLLFKIKG